MFLNKDCSKPLKISFVLVSLPNMSTANLKIFFKILTKFYKFTLDPQPYQKEQRVSDLSFLISKS